MFQPGLHQAEFKDGMTDERARMWVVVDSCDDEEGIVFGKRDDERLLGTGLHVGVELAASYEKVVEHREAAEFENQLVTAAFDRS